MRIHSHSLLLRNEYSVIEWLALGDLAQSEMANCGCFAIEWKHRGVERQATV